VRKAMGMVKREEEMVYLVGLASSRSVRREDDGSGWSEEGSSRSGCSVWPKTMTLQNSRRRSRRASTSSSEGTVVPDVMRRTSCRRAVRTPGGSAMGAAGTFSVACQFFFEAGGATRDRNDGTSRVDAAMDAAYLFDGCRGLSVFGLDGNGREIVDIGRERALARSRN
jgi:hypothetical protein